MDPSHSFKPQFAGTSEHVLSPAGSRLSSCIALILLLAMAVAMVPPAGAQQNNQAPAQEKPVQAGSVSVNPSNLRVYWKHEGEQIFVGRLDFILFGKNGLIFATEGPKSLTRRENGSVQGEHTLKGRDADRTTLRIEVAPLADNDGVAVRYRIKMKKPPEKIGKARWRFMHPKNPRWGPESWLHQTKQGRVKVDYGPILVDLTLKTGQFGWVNNGKAHMSRMNANSSARSYKDKRMRMQIRVEQRNKKKLLKKADSWIADKFGEFETYLQGWLRRDFGAQKDRVKEHVRQLQSEFQEFRSNYTAFVKKAQNDEYSVPFSLWKQIQEKRGNFDALLKRRRGLADKFQKALYDSARRFNDTMEFAVGLAVHAHPKKRLDKWSLFNMNFFRLSGKAWGFHANTEERIAAAQKGLKTVESLDMKVVQGVGAGLPMLRPARVRFTHNYIPGMPKSFMKPNRNSAEFRDRMAEDARRWIRATRKFDCIVSYKMGNEPFWAAGDRMPVWGYNPSTIGCSAETFQQQVKAKYGSFQNWANTCKKAIRNSRWQRKTRTKKLFEKTFQWKSFDDMVIPEDKVRGLTFVDYLKDKYDSLAALNRAWFGSADSERAFASWSKVFPPRPAGSGEPKTQSIGMPKYDLKKGAKVGESNPLPTRPQDIPAWTDWTKFWALSTNDMLVDMARRSKKAYPEADVSTNPITGHYLNGFHAASVNTATNPWLTAKNLDSLHIDFYSVGYLQAYLRSLAGTAHGRPFYISEAGGSGTPKKAQYMSMYSWAYGADGITFWRRDHHITPNVALGIAKAMDALNDPQLQSSSEPVTDGVALMFSLDSLYLMNAMDSPWPYLAPWQGGAQMLTRLQVLYDMYSDHRLAEKVPEHVNVIFAPGAKAVSDQTFSNLRQFVSDGGTLVVDNLFAVYDQYGNRRSNEERKRLLAQSNVTKLAEKKLRKWRRSLGKNDHNPMSWASPIPPWGEKLDSVIRDEAPRTVRCRKDDGSLAVVAPGARQVSDELLFVFIDPWAEDVDVSVRGEFDTARDLFNSAEVSLKQGKNGRCRVHVEEGPAIIRFSQNK